MRFALNHLHGFYMAHPKPSSWVLYGSPETFTMGFIRLTRNLHDGFYVAHLKPSPWVSYSSPETFIMGFIWITRNLHHGFYDNPFRETKGFNICLITSINQSEFYVDYPTSTNFKKHKQLTYLQLGITNIIYNLTNTDLIFS